MQKNRRTKKRRGKTFEITNDAAKIFVIADKISAGFCCEYYQLEAGEDDVILTGRNRFNPASGNAFRFDNNDNPDAVSNRKAGNCRGAIILIIAAILGFSIGFLATSGLFYGDAKPKLFTDDKLNITLTDDFSRMDNGNFTLSFASEDVAVFMLEERFALMDGFEDYTIREYGELVLSSNGRDCELKVQDGLTFFEYKSDTEFDTDYKYLAYLYKSDDAFWLVNFVVKANKADEYKDEIAAWAKSIEFK